MCFGQGIRFTIARLRILAFFRSWLLLPMGGVMDRTRILIVDDHEIFRKGLRSILESRTELEICGEATNGIEAVDKARAIRPDVVLMDISMPYLDGLQATRQIRRDVPGSQILLLSQHDSPHMLAAALKAGASAYVTKSQVSQCLVEALNAVIRREPFSWNTSEDGMSLKPGADLEPTGKDKFYSRPLGDAYETN
jgi:DNA-binding NarL/FixJ family response regulator